MKYIELWLMFSFCTIGIHGQTHWMVTEGGLIQPRLDSPFDIAHPYDLLAFLNQDTRWDNIINIHHDLTKRQNIIKNLWAGIERDTDVTTLLAEESNCIKVDQLNALDWYTSFLEDGKAKISNHELLMQNVKYGDSEVPDCKKISSLTFSMCVFEHLESMKQRDNLSASPEMSLPEDLSSEMTADQFGEWLAGILKRNSSSWLHYNMASLYWRVRGIAPKAIECSRRAVHYAPREYKDIALLSMGLILHRSKMTEDAIIVLGAATDHDPQCPINHFVLANAFAILGDYNSSVKHYDICLRLNPSFELAEKHKSGVLCHKFVWNKMKSIQDTLKNLREEITQYSQREAHWLKAQTTLLRTMKHPEDYDFMDVDKNYDRMSELTGLNIKELKKEGDKYSLIQYFLDGPSYSGDWLKEKGFHALESAYNLQRLVKHIGRHTNILTDNLLQEDYLNPSDKEILKEIGPTPTFPNLFPDIIKPNPFMEIKENKPEQTKQGDKKPSATENIESMFEYDTGIVLYPSTLKISRTTEDFDKEPEWPSNRLCKETAKTFPDNFEAIYQVFLPFENKGIRLRSLLTDKIGVSAQTEHELPWHPPICPNDKEATAFTQKKSQKTNIVSEIIVTDYLRQKLLEYVGDGDADSVRHVQDAEIGQRIYAAIQMNLAPKWLLYTISSLYWRVRGNNVNALHCILTASRTVETKYKDIVLVSLASVYLEMGYFDEALTAAEEAIKLNLYEPATNFLLAELNMIKKYRMTHMFHLKQVIRVEPNFMNGLARSLLHGWACLFRQLNILQGLELNDGDICTQVEPGMSMVCEKDGSNCHLTNVQCYSSQERESSTLVRMLELKDDNIQGAEVDDVDEHVFDHFVLNMPEDRSDKQAHQKNYDSMMKTVDKALKGCGKKGCHSIQPEDLEMKEEDCTYQQLELGYWLHVTSFRQLFSEADPRLAADILSMPPSNKKIPDCRLNVNPSEDFFLERFTNVDTEGWEPLLSLMHEFAEMFNFYDYVTLGAKIARYLEIRGESWSGAAAAGWWCGAGGRSACAVRCLAAAHARAPPAHAPHAARALAAILHIQSKQQDAKQVAYLSFYAQPKNKIEAFLVGVSHTYLAEYEPAVWMYRYALTFDDKFLPAKACLHATMCLMLFGEAAKAKPKLNVN